MKLFIAISLLFFCRTVKAQINVFSCSATNSIVTQGEIEATNYEFNRSCIIFDAGLPYQFVGSSNKKITAVRSIHIQEDFHSGAYNSEGSMWLKIDTLCDSNVYATNYMNLDAVEALKKFELGIDLPTNIEQRVQDFIATADTLNGGINPYLEWQLNAEIIFTNQATGFTKKIDGFYFQDFERDTTNADPNLWTWNTLTTTQNIRFRYSPEKLGLWDIQISVTLKDSSIYTYCPFTINVVANTADDAFVKVAANKRMLERNGKLFFPVGQNIPWPNDEVNPGPYPSGAYGTLHTGSYPHAELNQRMGAMKTEGVDYLRLILSPASLDIEFEEVGNYTDRLNDAWEIDNIIERAEGLDQYIHFNMLLHDNLQSQGAYFRFNWDWSSSYLLYGSQINVYAGSLGYKDKFGLDNDRPQDFFTNEGSKKFYKQKIRYIISRYGYSTHIALFELLSESNNAGNVYEHVYDIPNPTENTVPSLNLFYEPYREDPQHPLNLAWWHDEMAKYIKNELGHKEHLLTVSYGTEVIEPTDYSYSIPEIDIMTYNRYSDQLGDKYFVYQEEVRNKTAQYDKPILFSETGPLQEFACDRNSTYRKDAWMTAFTGVAGFNMWDGAHTPEVWHHLANVRSFVEDNQEVANLFLGSWETGYLNDNNNINNSQRKEANYLKGTYINQYGNPENLMVGAVSNLTDNFYTNNNFSTIWCNNNLPAQPLSQIKTNLYFGNGSLYSTFFNLSDFTLNWFNYESNYLTTTYSSLTSVLLLDHPLSCVTGNCNTKTAEIPFIFDWDFSDYNKNLQNSSNPNERIIPTEGNFTPKSSVKNQLLVFPNPAQNNIQVICTDETIITFRLVDAKGKTVRIIDLRELNKSIDITNLDSGIFVILGVDKSNVIKYQKRWVKL